MGNSKLFLLISSLNALELKNILSFLESDINSYNKKTLFLFKYLCNCVKKKRPPIKKEAFEHCYPSLDFDDGKFRVLNTHCFQQIEAYLVYSTINDQENKNLKSLILQKYYRQNQLDKLFKSTTYKFNKEIGQNPINNYDVLEERFKSEYEQYEYLSKQGRKQDLNLNRLLSLSEELYYARKIKLACFVMAHAAVYQQNYDFEDLAITAKEIKEKKLDILPSIGAYYLGYHLLSKPFDLASLNHYKAYIQKHQSCFPDEENRTLYFVAINCCIKRLNRGESAYGLLGLELYENALTARILHVDGFLSRFTYRNIAMMAIRSDQLEWAENFSHKYADALRKQDKESAYSFNLALVYYYKGKFSEALEYIQKADFKDHLIHLAVKNLQCKIYYELDSFDALDFLIDAMEIYIRRNKILGYHRESYLNTTKYFKKLLRLNHNDTEKKRKLLEAVRKEKVLLEKDWILKKLELK